MVVLSVAIYIALIGFSVHGYPIMPDISRWQPPLSRSTAAQVKSAALGIMFKATEGVTWKDPNFLTNVAAAKAVNLKWGAYHFLRTHLSGAAQAEHFARTIPSGASFACLDWEDGGLGPAVDFMKAVKARLSIPVVLYCGWHCRAYGVPSGSAAPAGLIIAAYMSSVDPYVPRGWRDRLVAWQYTDGRINKTPYPKGVPGIGNCDVSYVFRPDVLFGSGGGGGSVPVRVPPPVSPPQGLVVRVTASALNMRSGPSTRYSVVGVVYRGTRLTVLESAGSARAKVGVYPEWLHVRDPAGRKGYVAAWYVSL